MEKENVPEESVPLSDKDVAKEAISNMLTQTAYVLTNPMWNESSFGYSKQRVAYNKAKYLLENKTHTTWKDFDPWTGGDKESLIEWLKALPEKATVYAGDGEIGADEVTVTPATEEELAEAQRIVDSFVPDEQVTIKIRRSLPF